MKKFTNNNLFRGGVKFPTGGESPRPAFAAESVQFRYRRYSPDERIRTQILEIFVAPLKSFARFLGVSAFPRGKGIFMENAKLTKKFDVRRLVFTALMAALSAVLSELKFELPFMPSFISFDFSDVPAVLSSMTMGPLSGAFVCLVKNIFGCFTSATGCVGELSNFLLGVFLVLPAGILTHKNSKLSRAVIGCLSGSVTMALLSFVSNYFIVYPIYNATVLPTEAIIGMYQSILPSVDNLAECIVIFNMPFTFAKGLIASIISLVLYKKLRPVFNGIYRT